MAVSIESTPEAKISVEVLTAMITPAILISACAALILSTSQRLGRIIDRIRQFSDVFSLKDHPGTIQLQRDGLNQLQLLLTRARLLQASMMNLYLAVAMLVVTSLMIGLTATTHNHIHWIPVAIALLGILVFLLSSSILFWEGYLAMKNTSEEMRSVQTYIQREWKHHETEFEKGIKKNESSRSA